MPEKLTPEERPDWILNSIAGRTHNVEDIYKDGLAIGDFSIADNADKYWEKEGVRNMFRTPEGKEDKNSFTELYNTERDNFLKLRQAEFDAVNYKAQYTTQLDKKLGVERKTPQINKINPDLWGRSFGFDYYDGTGFSKKQQGIREAAIKQGVKVGPNEYVDTNQFKGLAKFAKKPDGSYDINEKGSTYLVPVGDGEEVKSTDQLYSSLTDWMGYYGHDYEWNQIGGSLVKNAVGFLSTTMDSLAEFPKAAITAWNGTEGRKTDAYKGIVNFENWWKQGNPSMTEEGMAGGFWSFESLTDLGQQVMWQIFGMMATGGSVGQTAKLLGAGDAAGKIGSTAGRLFMTGLAAGPMADVAREQGLSGREIAGMLALTSAAIYPVTMLEEFVATNKLVGTSYVGIQQTMKDAMNVIMTKGIGNKAAMKAAGPNLVMRLKNVIAQANKLPSVVGSAGGEALEETIEQVVDVGVRNLFNVYNNVISEEGSDVRKKNFEFDWVKEAEALGYAAVGGALGGAIAGPLMRKFFNQNPDQAYDIYAMVADGRSKTILDYIDYMESQGRMSYTFKDSKDSYTEDESKSQNAQAANIARGTIKYLDKIYNDQQLDKVYPNNKAKAAAFRNAMETSSVGKDAATLFTEIHQLDESISELRKTEGTVNDRDIDEKTQLRNEKQEALDRIKRGEFVGDYVAEGLYNMNAIGRQDEHSAWNRHILSGKNFVNLSKTGPTFTEAANEKISENNKQLEEADKSATVKKFNRLTNQGKQRIQNNANQQFNDDFDQLKPHLDRLNDQIFEMTNGKDDIGVHTDDILNPNARDNALTKLKRYASNENADANIKPLISNLIETNDRIKAIEDAKIEEISVPIEEKELMLNMIEVSENGQMRNTTIPIAKKILEQLAYEKETNRNGVSTYSNVEETTDMLNSIYARIAQVQANPQIIPKANQIYEANNQDKVRVLSREEQLELQGLLGTMGAEVERLHQISLQNANSADQQLRAAALAAFDKKLDLLSTIQTDDDLYVGTEYQQVGEIIASHNESMAAAIHAGDVEAYFHAQREMEHELFEYGKGKKEQLLSVFKFPPNPTATEINSGMFDNRIKQYDYMRGVLAEDANVIWNAYKDIVANLRDVSPDDKKQLMAASDEQLSAIISAVQGLSAQQYATFADIPNMRTQHHNMYYLNSIGGAGKTALLSPLIAGIYQKINGGEVHLTSLMNEGDGINKKRNLLNAVIDFFNQGNNTIGIDLHKSPNDIYTIIKNGAEGVNLIVFDEVTLLSSRQLDQLQEVLDIVNANRQAAGSPLLKVLFTGDSNQNSPSQSKQSTEEVMGIYVKSRHMISQSDPLTFSFRVENDQLRLFSDWTRAIQNQIGESNPIMTQYQRSRTKDEKDNKKGQTLKTEKGVRIHNNKADFDREVKRIIDRLKTTETLESTVYIITNKAQKGDLSSELVNSGIRIMTSEEAQGEEWNYVFYHPENGKIFGTGKNLVPKKRFHTAITRSKQYFTALLEEPNIKSKEGTVYTVSPISPSGTTKQAQLDRATKILGNAASEIEVKNEYSYDNFKDTYSGDFAETGVPSPTNIPPEAPSSGGTLPPTGTPDTPSTASTPQGHIAEFVKTRNRRDEITMPTFFTVEGQEETKKRALYDKHLNKDVDTSKYRYVLTIAKVGSPQYENYVNNNPKFNGSYAIFIEGIVDGKRAVIGTLPEEDLQDFISKRDILQGKESISISLDKDVMTNSMGFKPVFTWDKTQRRTLGALKEQYGESITFGSVRVALQDVKQSKEAKEGGAPTTTKGNIILPISSAYTSAQEINNVLLSSPEDNFVNISGIDRSYVPLDNILEELESFRHEDGSFDMTRGGKVYEALWSHDTKDRISDGERKLGRITEAINEIHKKIPSDQNEYKAFVANYTHELKDASTVNSEGKTVAETDAKLAEMEAKHGNERIDVGIPASYLLVRYINSLNAGNKVEVAKFERLLSDIQQIGKFKENGGFRFNPRTGPHTLENSIHMEASKEMDALYDKYLTTNISNIAHPSIQVSKNDLINALENGTINPIVDTDQSVSVEGAVESDSQDALRNDLNIHIDENATLENPDSASLYDFQSTHFNGPLINLFPDAISIFKREFYSKFFNLGTATIVPTNTAVNNLKTRFGDNAYLPSEELKNLDLVNSKVDQRKYIDHVLSQNMNFLLNKYAPTVKEVDITQEDGTVIREYRFVSSHHKNRSYGEKESFSLLKEGMTEMVATQLENTPIVSPVLDERGNVKPGEYINTDRYIDVKRDAEEIIRALKNTRDSDNESIASMLANSSSEILQSIYARFYSPDTMIIDGVETKSLSAFEDMNVVPMVDAMSVFFLSGEIFNLGSVNINTEKSGIPSNPFWRTPNEIREHGQSAMKRVATDVKSGASTMSVNRSGNTTIYVMDGDTFIKGSQEQYSTEKVLEGFNAIGMGDFITEDHLNDIMSYEASQMQLPAAPSIDRDIDRRIPARNKYLMDNIIFPALTQINSGTISFIRDSEMIYRTVSRMGGINTSMDALNVAGNRVYRLRNTSPIFHFNRKLRERSNDSRFSRNMFSPNGRFELTDFYLKDGFKWVTDDGVVRNTQNNDLRKDEILEYDLLWGFADTLNQTKDTNPTFALSAMVYSDGGSDVTPIIRVKDPFNTKAIVAELFDSRVQYYSSVEKNLLAKWNKVLNADHKSLAQVQQSLSGRGKKTIEEVQRIQGLMPNLDYVADSKGNAKLNPELISDIRLYKSGKLSSFEAILDSHAADLRSEIDLLDQKFNLKKRLSERIKQDPDTVINAFYYNWVAASSEITLLSMGSKHQYKGTNETSQYIDLSKRAKSQISNHSMQVFRNSGWEADRQRRIANNERMDDKFINEGMKLSRSYKVAYTTDPKVNIESFAGEIKYGSRGQEIYDGATFVTPLTRIFQVASNGGKHGTNVAHVMKNITTAINESGTTFIKHAEFELTIPLMREGTDRVINMVQGMLSPKFNEPIQVGEDSVVSAWDYLTNQLGVNEDLSNAEDEHFKALALFLVENGVQDVPVMEVIPRTSLKTGGGAINNMEDSNHLKGLVTETIDIFNKGTQLDASKDATEGLLTRATSQLFNVIGLNWRNPEQTLAVHQGLADLAAEVEEDFSSLNDDQLEARLKNLVRVAQDTDNQSLTYQQKLIDTDYSIDDRQMLNRIISLLNADIVARGIAPKFQGGQYVVHPANGLLKVYENPNGTISLKSKRSFKDNEGRNLVLHAPTMQINTADAIASLEEQRAKQHEKYARIESELSDEEFEAHKFQHINIDLDFDERISNLQSRDIEGLSTISLRDTPQYRKMINASKRLNAARNAGNQEAIAIENKVLLDARNAVDTMLQSGQWEEGYAEIILPSEMKKDFKLTEGIDLNDVDVSFFKRSISLDRKSNNMKPLTAKALNARAEKMFEGFQQRLEGLMIRIPTTGKHSALSTRVVAFMNGSDNSVFVPADLLMLQGADQDYDKGSYLTYEAVAGFIPTVTITEEGEGENKVRVITLDPFFNQAIPKWRTVHIDRNYIAKAFKGKVANIDPVLYKELLKHTVPVGQGVAVRLNQHEEAIRAGIKNKIVQDMRDILNDPKNAVEGSMSVDNILQELRDIRDNISSDSKFFQDSYLSYAQMREENQSGVSLTGIFANSGKAYQIAYGVLKSQNIEDNAVLDGLSNTDGTTMSNTWARFAALTNAAVDGAKEGILGTLRIGEHNANMVNYMVATGSSFTEISNMILENDDFMQDLKDNTRYTSEFSFYDPSKKWSKSKPELVEIYKKGIEFGTLANSILNRDLPNSPQDMYGYKQRIEGFINRSYKAAGFRAPFDLLNFIRSDTYANMHIAQYNKLITSGKTSNFHHINILNVLKNAPHVRAYMKLYAMSVDILKRKSNISRVTFNMADAYKTSVNSDVYRSMNEFVYGVAVEQYMRGRKSSDGKYDLGTIDGRNDFVDYMGSTRIGGFIKNMKAKSEYKGNPFIHGGIFVDTIPRHNYKQEAPQLRTYDINNIEEQKLLMLEVGFDQLSSQDRADIVNYSLITTKGAMGKGSLAQLFNNIDTQEFNDFLKTFDNQSSIQLTMIYDGFRRNSANTTNYHNSIPYSLIEEVKQVEQETRPDKKVLDSRIKENYINTINGILRTLNTIAIEASGGKAKLFRTIPKNATMNAKYKFFEGLPPMTASELVLYTLGISKNLKTKQKEYLENTYKGMTGKKVSNLDIAETIKRCK